MPFIELHLHYNGMPYWGELPGEPVEEVEEVKEEPKPEPLPPADVVPPSGHIPNVEKEPELPPVPEDKPEPPPEPKEVTRVKVIEEMDGARHPRVFLEWFSNKVEPAGGKLLLVETTYGSNTGQWIGSYVKGQFVNLGIRLPHHTYGTGTSYTLENYEVDRWAYYPKIDFV